MLRESSRNGICVVSAHRVCGSFPGPALVPGGGTLGNRANSFEFRQAGAGRMIDATSILLGVGGVLLYLLIRLVLVPRLLRTYWARRIFPEESWPRGRALLLRIGIAGVLLWIWVILTIVVTGGLTHEGNRQLLGGALFFTALLSVAALAWLRHK